MKKSTKKTRRVTPAKSRTPVIAGRVPASLHAQLKQAAAESGRSLSDELAWRAGLSFEWERAFEDTRKLLADAKRANKANLRQAMRDDGPRKYFISRKRSASTPCKDRGLVSHRAARRGGAGTRSPSGNGCCSERSGE